MILIPLVIEPSVSLILQCLSYVPKLPPFVNIKHTPTVICSLHAFCLLKLQNNATDHSKQYNKAVVEKRLPLIEFTSYNPTAAGNAAILRFGRPDVDEASTLTVPYAL